MVPNPYNEEDVKRVEVTRWPKYYSKVGRQEIDWKYK